MRKYERIQDVPLDIIDEPGVAIRSSIADSSLDDLVDSIRTHGLIQPIVVRPLGARFEIVAGHRRYLAFKRLRNATIPCIIRNIVDARADVIKLAENFYRENVNVVDEARFYSTLLKKHNLSVKELAGMINRSEGYIYDRVKMIDWDPLIVQYLYEGKLDFSVAKHLSKITADNIRRNWLDIAIRCGITTAQAREWVEQFRKGALPLEPDKEIIADIESGGFGFKIEKECVLCGKIADIRELKVIVVHPNCEEYLSYYRKFGPLSENSPKPVPGV